MTFSQIVAAMIAYLQGLNSRLTDFTSTSILGQILNAVAQQIDSIYLYIDNAQNQAYISTATGTGLDNKGADFGLPRKQPTEASWYFTFIKNQVSTSQWPIPAGTLITTIPDPGAAPITYTTNADSYMPAGSTSVIVLATATVAGTSGNIAPNTPLLIGSNPPPGIDGVQLQNLNNGTYGTDLETDDDYRTRLLAALASKAQGTVAWYKSTAESVSGVASALVNPQGRGSGTVDVYIVGANNTIPATSLINQVQSTIDAGRIITDDAKVFAPTPVTVNRAFTVKVDANYDLGQVQSAVQTAVTNYINGLGVGGGPYNELYANKVYSEALTVAGTITTIPAATPDPDVSFTAFQLPQAGTISITTEH